MKVLSENSVLKIDGKYIECKAVLTYVNGGRKVVYFDKNGVAVKDEALSRSSFKDVVIDEAESEKSKENRLRRRLRLEHNFLLRKSRKAVSINNEGNYMIISGSDDSVKFNSGNYNITLNQIEDFLNGKEVFTDGNT